MKSADNTNRVTTPHVTPHDGNGKPNPNPSGIVGLCSLIASAAEAGVLRKCVFSKPDNTAVLRAEAVSMTLGGATVLKCVVYMKDGKAVQSNHDPGDDGAMRDICSGWGQINLLSSAGDCEYRRAKKAGGGNGDGDGDGDGVLLGGAKLARALADGAPGVPRVAAQTNDREKNRLLRGDEDFLRELAISSPDGRIHDKKQAKFRQICRFLEYVRDIEEYLPREGTLRIADLCCGKSYLSFAVYHYFAVMRGRPVSMTGVDLKPDVIAYCTGVAQRLGYSGLEFVCGDVTKYVSDVPPSLVVSLHACDVATDLVLSRAVGWEARVILATPCCQHELASLIDCPELSFVTRHPMLKRKLCDALTDALRLSYLEAEGYAVVASELVDPEDTPKNILLRAVRRNDFDPGSGEARKKREKYNNTRQFLLGSRTEHT